MATIQFVIQGKKNPCMIYLRFSIAKGQVYKPKTGRLIDRENWSTDTNLPKMRQDGETTNLKIELTELKAHIYKMYDIDHAKGIAINGDWLKNHIDLFFNRLPNVIEDDGVVKVNLSILSEWCKEFLVRVVERGNFSERGSVNAGTVKKYNTIVSKLEAFQKFKKKQYYVKDIDVSFRHEFLKYLNEQERLSSNTSGRYIKFVKTIALDARKNGIEVSPMLDDIKGHTVKTQKITLSFEELNEIKRMLSLDGNLQVARDWLVISCFVGQRVGDLFTMNSKMISIVDGFRILTIEQQKTGKIVEIPLHEEVEEVLKKYNGEFPPVFLTEPESNKVVYNRYVKEVCRTAGLTEMTKGNLYNNATGRYSPGEYEKFKLVSSHIGRRSFATNFYGEEDYPTPLLMSVTGHSTEKMFLEYIGKKPIQHALNLAKIWKRKRDAQLNLVMSA